MPAKIHTCQSEKIGAFIDGEMEPAESQAFETHLKQCPNCAAELHQQQQFMCELDSMLTGPLDLDVPANFAQVVAVRAESDMRGVRDRAEHNRALLFSVLLAIAAFALLGVSASEKLILSAQSLLNNAAGILGLLGKTIYDAAAGFSVILRVLSGGLRADSRFAGLTALALVALAICLLSLLITRFHRTRFTE